MIIKNNLIFRLLYKKYLPLANIIIIMLAILKIINQYFIHFLLQILINALLISGNVPWNTTSGRESNLPAGWKILNLYLKSRLRLQLVLTAFGWHIHMRSMSVMPTVYFPVFWKQLMRLDDLLRQWWRSFSLYIFAFFVL